MIKLVEIKQNGKKLKLEGVTSRTEFRSWQDFEGYSDLLCRVVNNKLTFTIEYDNT